MSDNELIAAYLLVLKQNTKIVFDNGDWLKADITGHFIEFGFSEDNTPRFLGNYILNKDGIKSALRELTELRKD